MMVTRDLYVLNLSGAAWIAMIFETLLDLGYKTSRAYLDVWMKPKTNPQTGKEYYAYVLVYVDDFLNIHYYPEIFMNEFKGFYRLKYGILEPPTIYLGPDVENV